MAKQTWKPEPGMRVRDLDDGGSSALSSGSGEITDVDGDIISVRWDNSGFPYRSNRLAEEIVEVPIVCSYAKVTWKRGGKWGIDGMIIVCDVHGAPGPGALYEVELGQESTVTDRCQGPWT